MQEIQKNQDTVIQEALQWWRGRHRGGGGRVHAEVRSIQKKILTQSSMVWLMGAIRTSYTFCASPPPFSHTTQCRPFKRGYGEGEQSVRSHHTAHITKMGNILQREYPTTDLTHPMGKGGGEKGGRRNKVTCQVNDAYVKSQHPTSEQSAESGI